MNMRTTSKCTYVSTDILPNLIHIGTFPTDISLNRLHTKQSYLTVRDLLYGIYNIVLELSMIVTMADKFQLIVCTKFCVKLGKYITDVPERFRQVFGEHTLGWSVTFLVASLFPIQFKVTSTKGDQSLGKR